MTDDINKKLIEIKERRKNRLSICNDCDYFNKFDTSCLQCGCIMSIKTNLEDSKCPLGKW